MSSIFRNAGLSRRLRQKTGGRRPAEVISVDQAAMIAPEWGRVELRAGHPGPQRPASQQLVTIGL